MKKKIFLSILLTSLLVIGVIFKISDSTSDNTLSSKELRTMYPAVHLQTQFVNTQDLSVDRMTDISKLIVTGTLVSMPEDIIIHQALGKNSTERYLANKNAEKEIDSVDFKFKRVKLKIDKTFKGESGKSIINITVPKISADIFNNVKLGDKYLFMLVPAPNIGDNNWDTIDQLSYYISQSDQIVPFCDDSKFKDFIGMKVSKFKEYIESRNKDSK
ncbi:MAG TPA: hypothetical protein VHT34_07600 [Clostridia bacterium]|nr:hypothetical protein [Clostridia bacterium]